MIQLLVPLVEAKLGLGEVSPSCGPGGEVRHPGNDGVMVGQVEPSPSKEIQAKEIIQSGDLLAHLKGERNKKNWLSKRALSLLGDTLGEKMGGVFTPLSSTKLQIKIR